MDTRKLTPKFPTVEEQRAFWEKHDIGGNVLPDRIEANEKQYHRKGCFSKTGGDCTCGNKAWKEPEWTLRDEVGESFKEIP